MFERHDHMEVGVDIGSLQSVMLANMPPMRFQLSAARGPRRTTRQAFAVFSPSAVAEATTSSTSISRENTGDRPPVPSSRFAPRNSPSMLSKECLRRAFQAAGVRLVAQSDTRPIVMVSSEP